MGTFKVFIRYWMDRKLATWVNIVEFKYFRNIDILTSVLLPLRGSYNPTGKERVAEF